VVVTPTALSQRQSAVLIPVPEAEPVVGRHRARLDRAAGWGVPAHVTVLYPFVQPDAITDATIEAAAAAVASVRAFDCVFRHTSWFDEEVVWLSPDPDEPFRALTSAVWTAFPQFPPYGGAFTDVVPHLTVGESAIGGSAALRAAEADVNRALPVRTHVSHAWLMTGAHAPSSWRAIAELPLAT